MFSRSSEIEIAKDSFVVLQFEGMHINGNPDAINKATSSISLLRVKKDGTFISMV